MCFVSTRSSLLHRHHCRLVLKFGAYTCISGVVRQDHATPACEMINAADWFQEAKHPVIFQGLFALFCLLVRGMSVSQAGIGTMPCCVQHAVGIPAARMRALCQAPAQIASTFGTLQREGLLEQEEAKPCHHKQAFRLCALRSR